MQSESAEPPPQTSSQIATEPPYLQTKMNSKKVHSVFQGPPQTLIGFPSLPIKLRIMIWKAACFIPRNVDLYIKPEYPASFSTKPWNLAYTFRSRCLPPALLHVNREARQEGLKWYKLAFEYESEAYNFIGEEEEHVVPENWRHWSPARIYINWNVD